MTLDEFKAGLDKIGLAMSEEEAEAEFATIDKNGGGVVLFDEFCHWVAIKMDPNADEDIDLMDESGVAHFEEMGKPGQDGRKLAAKKEAAAASSAAPAEYDDQPDLPQTHKYDKVQAEFEAALGDKKKLKGKFFVRDSGLAPCTNSLFPCFFFFHFFF